MKKPEWKNGKPVLNTGCKTFDSYINYIGTGNVWANGLFANYIRPYSETECNGRENEPGHLLKFDLDAYKQYMFSPTRYQIEKRMKEMTQSAILYMFYHKSHGKYVIHGFVLTTADHRFITDFVTGPTYKSQQVILGVRDYICEPEKVAAGA